MYKLISGISLLIRLFVLPNPFEGMKYGFLINFAAEPVFHFVTFNIVGLFYVRSSAPALGSFLYLIFYVIHIGLLQLWNYFGSTGIAGVIILVGYITLIFLVLRKGRMGMRY